MLYPNFISINWSNKLYTWFQATISSRLETIICLAHCIYLLVSIWCIFAQMKYHIISWWWSRMDATSHSEMRRWMSMSWCDHLTLRQTSHQVTQRKWQRQVVKNGANIVSCYFLRVRRTCDKERTGQFCCLALARWAGWSAGQVGCHVKCWKKKWSRGGGQGPLAREGRLYSDKLQGPRVPSYATAHGDA